MVGISLRLFCLTVLAAALVPPARAANCAGDSTGLVPLTDLGAGLYQGYQGGLYPGGSNQRPPAHEAAGLAIANAIAPLDTFGVPSPGGRVVLISIGMSNATQEFSRFVPQAMSYPARNPALLVVDCAQGGQTANEIRDPSWAYWDYLAGRLRSVGSAPAQVQVVWLKEANAGPTGGFPAEMLALQSDLAAIARVIKLELPNAKLCYLSSRTYGGYASTTLNPEPYAYESGYAVKGVIEQQIAGVDSLNFDPDSGAVKAPWLSWGPYLWADGLEPRSDGMIWNCSDFRENDGTHPSESGREKVADSLFTFFATDPTSVPWFLGGPTAGVGSGEGGMLHFAASPNPARGGVEVAFATRAGEPWRLEALDATGRRVAEVARGTGTGATERRRWDGGARGAETAPGVYWLRLTRGAAVESRRLVRVGGR